MAIKTYLKHTVLLNLATRLVNARSFIGAGNKMFPIPRGGVPVAYLLKCVAPNLEIVEKPEEADFFIDDIIDSGYTMQKWCDDYPGKMFFSLIDKSEASMHDAWIVFPWEDSDTSDDDSIVGTIANRITKAGVPYFANDNVSSYIFPGELDLLQDEIESRVDHLLRGLLIDIDNDHNTVGTAKRVAKMYLREVFKGRYIAPPKVTDFPNVKGLDEMYTTGPITIRSACSHHIVPILGQCWIGIVPGERVIGLSKFNRIVDWIASRPQIQEEMTVQIADFIEDQIKPKGLAVVVKATHECMTWRGVKEPTEAAMTTSIVRGVFRDKPEARAEFFSLAGIKNK
jgi:GTP cyclohydrolase I